MSQCSIGHEAEETVVGHSSFECFPHFFLAVLLQSGQPPQVLVPLQNQWFLKLGLGILQCGYRNNAIGE